MFETEDDLRNFIARCLARQESVQTEKVCTPNGGRYDILGSKSGVIEVKLELTRTNIYSAFGQANHYASALNIRKRVLVGLTPISDKERIASYRLARSLTSTNKDLEVWFIDSNTKRTKRFKSVSSEELEEPFPSLLTISLLALLLIMAACLIWWVDKEVVNEPRINPWKNGCYECDKWQKPMPIP